LQQLAEGGVFEVLGVTERGVKDAGLFVAGEVGPGDRFGFLIGDRAD
jgi:hypothetical protein